MLSFLRFLVLVAGSVLMAATANAKRVALVIGNDNYVTATKLFKARNDADAMARELRGAGFAVQLHKDLNYREMVKTIDVFANSITGGDEVVVFFAGHGVQIKSGNYLLPVDIEAETESQVEKTAYGLLDLTDKLSEAKAAFSLVVVDACRDNPLKSRGRSVGLSRGLSAIEPAKGQMIVYSASRGQSALDRLNDRDPNPNSVFTREFISKMKTPGVKIEDIVRSVQDSVEALAKTVSQEQRPALYNESRGNFYFYGTTSIQVAPTPNVVPEMSVSQREDKFWDDAKAAGNKEAYEAYLEIYPQGRYLSLARANIARLTERSATPTSPPLMAQGPPGTSFKDCDDCPEMVVIPAGTFLMGSLMGPFNQSSTQPMRNVNIKSFSIGKFEVTQKQWFAVMGTEPSKFKGRTLPVEQVSWNDAQEFVQKLSQKTGKQYRLPTEAEWEYAARAGSQTMYFFGDDASQLERYAWFNKNSAMSQPLFFIFGYKTNPVGEKLPNSFGLHDIYGNVLEWTQDCWNENYNGAPRDGSAWAVGDCRQRVSRGGPMALSADVLTSYFRFKSSKEWLSHMTGLRVARTP